jgi:hypothetical protein
MVQRERLVEYRKDPLGGPDLHPLNVGVLLWDASVKGLCQLPSPLQPPHQALLGE